ARTPPPSGRRWARGQLRNNFTEGAAARGVAAPPFLDMSRKDPAWASVSEIVNGVSAHELDLQAVVRAHLDAIDRLDSKIHAYVCVDRNARASAGALSGVTVAVKDNLPVA